MFQTTNQIRVLLAKIDWPIYHRPHRLPVVMGVNKPLYKSANQREKDIYETTTQNVGDILRVGEWSR